MRHLVFALLMALLLSTSAAGAGSGGEAYITNSGSSILPVIDASGHVDPTLNVGATTWGVATDPKGARVYVTSLVTGTVYAIDTSTKAVVSLQVGSSAFGVAVSPDGTRLYVTHTMTGISGGRRRLMPGFVSAVAVSPTGALSLAGTPLRLFGGTTGVAGGTTGVAVSPLGDRVYVANGSGYVSVINPVDFSLRATVFVSADSLHPASLVGVAVSPDGKYLYAADQSNNKLMVMDTAGMAADAELVCAQPKAPLVCVAVGTSPFGVAVSPNGTRVFVANSGSHTVSVINPLGMPLSAPVVISTTDVGDGPGGVGPHGVAVTSDSARVYVANMRNNTVWVLDGTSGAPLTNRTNPIQDPSLQAPIAFGNSVISDPVIHVDIDIKPGSDQNTINLGSHGVVPVAILSTSTFNAPVRVNPATVTLAGAPVQLKGNGLPVVEEYDVNGDGLVDLVVHVQTDAMQLSPSDTTAVLKGKTWADESIQGEGAVRVVPSK